MNKLALLKKLNNMLLEEMPQYVKFASHYSNEIYSQRQLFRSLMNVRPPMVLSEEYIELQNILLSLEKEERDVVDVSALPNTFHPNIILWRGDITRLSSDAIVNAANSELLGCFHPCHSCIDNAIHSAAGSQLRDECNRIMKKQGFEEPTGQAKLTGAYNLPSKYVIHTVGPMISGLLTEQDCKRLKSCYWSCLSLAEENQLKSIAFSCISTGEYRFPQEEAAKIAVNTVRQYFKSNPSEMKVIFNVYKESDEAIYRKELEYD